MNKYDIRYSNEYARIILLLSCLPLSLILINFHIYNDFMYKYFGVNLIISMIIFSVICTGLMILIFNGILKIISKNIHIILSSR
jgi:hypothetical protein